MSLRTIVSVVASPESTRGFDLRDHGWYLLKLDCGHVVRRGSMPGGAMRTRTTCEVCTHEKLHREANR